MSLSKYSDYKKSDVEWLGEIPSHWNIKPCREVLIDRNERNEPLINENYLSLMANIGIILYEEKGDIGNKKPEDLGKCKQVYPGDLVINSMNYGIGSYGLSKHRGVCSPVYIVLTPKLEKIEERYAFRILETKKFQQYAQSFGNGILEHRASISWDILKNIGLPLPPIEEQLAILEFLDNEIAKIDTLVIEQEKMIGLLKEKRQTVISHSVTKGLDPKVKMKSTGVKWLGEVPEHWEATKIKNIGNIRYGIGEPPIYRDEGTCLIRATNVHAGKIFPKGLVYVDANDIPAQRIVWLKKGDIIVVRSGAYTGDSAIIPSEYENSIAGFDMVLRCVSASPGFIQYALLSNYLKNNQIDLEKSRAAQPHLNAEELGSCRILLPPAKEQNEIEEYLNKFCEAIDKLIDVSISATSLLQERRSALISAAVTGQIDVRNYQPKEFA